jgi:hypothetical protein
MSTAECECDDGKDQGRGLEKHAPIAEMLQLYLDRKEAQLSVEKSLELNEGNQ